MNNKIFYDSWGYDMTMNDYVKVIEMGEKTAKVIKIGYRVENDNGMGGGKSYPDINKTIGEPFRLRVKRYKDSQIYLKGSYKYCDGSDSKRMGCFSQYNGNGNYYNTWD